MKKILITLSLITLFAFTGFAQNNAEYKSAVQKMLIASGAENTFKASITQMFGMMKQQQPQVTNDFWVSLEDEMLKTSITDLIDLLVPIYQKHLSLDEINQLTAFYGSPIGKKFAEKTPLITQESMAAGQQWGMKIGQKIIDKIKEKSN
jgi:hypothetical protein